MKQFGHTAVGRSVLATRRVVATLAAALRRELRVAAAGRRGAGPLVALQPGHGRVLLARGRVLDRAQAGDPQHLVVPLADHPVLLADDQ